MMKTKRLYTFGVESFITPFVIPMVGVEPTLPKEHDFESVMNEFYFYLLLSLCDITVYSTVNCGYHLTFYSYD